jgi:cytochrome oxidase assembly protein ShyY1
MPPRFTFHWTWAAATLLACVVFGSLGRWQWQRGDYRTAQWQAFEAPGEPRDVGGAQLASLPRYARVRLTGRFDGEHQFLLDNISEGGRAGYGVVTPLKLEDGTAVLVNRGWVPGTGHREQLPDVALAASGTPRPVIGRVGMLPVAGLAAGHAPPPAEGPWPRLTSFATEADLAAALPYPLVPGVLLLDAGDPDGYVRDWRPPGLEPARHYAYAVQWWAFAVLAIVLFVVLNRRRKPKPS